MEQLGITEKESKELKFYKKVLKQQKEVMKKKKKK